MQKNTYFILDSSFFFGIQQLPSFDNRNLIITPEIKEEIKDHINQLRIDALLSNGTLKILSYTQESSEELKQKLGSYANYSRLSTADCSILMLALTIRKQELDAEITIVTDDYEIQNIAQLLHFKLLNIRRKSISTRRIYKRVCKACKYVFTNDEISNDSVCPNCGYNKFFYHTIIKRK